MIKTRVLIYFSQISQWNCRDFCWVWMGELVISPKSGLCLNIEIFFMGSSDIIPFGLKIGVLPLLQIVRVCRDGCFSAPFGIVRSQKSSPPLPRVAAVAWFRGVISGVYGRRRRRRLTWGFSDRAASVGPACVCGILVGFTQPWDRWREEEEEGGSWMAGGKLTGGLGKSQVDHQGF